MKTSRFVPFFAGRLFVLSLALFLSASVRAAFKFSVENDHTNLLYRVGEEATFRVSVTEKDGSLATNGTVEVALDSFGPATPEKQTRDLAAGNPFAVTGTLAEPGFLRLTLRAKGSAGFVWSVGYDPEKLEKGSPSPADFDAFWAEARAKLAREVPIDAKVQKIAERSTAEFDFFRISFATYGRRVYGYMSVPTDKSKAPYPVEFQVSAAGFGGWTNDMSGDAGRIKVFFAVYPWAPHWDWKELGLNVAYDCLNAACKAKCGTEYSQSGIAKSREDYFFYPVLLGLDRAVTWVAAREDVDRSRFCYQGTSQGGGFGFYLTGLNPAFTRAAFFVPAITDTMGYLKGRQSGWPQVVENQPADQRSAAEKNAPYFDAANFASRIRCPVRVAVGFSDPTCPPCAVYSAYNEIKVADKGIVHGFGMTHSCYGWIYGQLGDWLWK